MKKQSDQLVAGWKESVTLPSLHIPHASHIEFVLKQQQIFVHFKLI
ncbi:hypothetical protein ACQ4M3_01145 [Leptolyngbya sp. AN03gr2]